MTSKEIEEKTGISYRRVVQWAKMNVSDKSGLMVNSPMYGLTMIYNGFSNARHREED